MGTTPVLGHPYPEGTDLVIAGDDAIQALAEHVEYSHRLEGAIVLYGDSPSSGASGATVDLALPGDVALMSGFNFDGGSLTRTGAARMFLYHVETELTVTSGSSTDLSSALTVWFNGSQFAGTYDRITTSSGLVGRKVVHHVSVPVLMSPGDTVLAKVSGSGGSFDAGQCSLRVYPMGPGA